MITLNRKTPKEKYNLDLNIRYVKCMHHSGYLNDDFHMNKHDFYEINFCKSSDILFTLGKDTLYLTNGDILIIPPNTNHHFTSSEMVSNYFDIYTLWISNDYFEILLNKLDEINHINFSFQFPSILHTADSSLEFEIDFPSLYKISDTYGTLSEAYLCGAVLCLLVKIASFATSCSKAITELQPELINEIIAYIDEHFTDNISLEDLSIKYHISKSCLNNLFQKKLRISCYQYIRKKRLAESVRLIRAGVPFKQVASRVGFNDYSSFYRAFKNTYKISPAECLAQKNEDVPIENLD